MEQSSRKNAIVFGATSGIGMGIAKILVEKNYNVLITGRRIEKLEEIQKTNPSHYTIKQHDITNITSSDTFFDDLSQTFDHVDLIILSSGVGAANYKLEWDIDLPTLNTNILGITKLLQLSYNYFNQQSYGHLVGISSVASIRGNRHVPAYFASKAYQSNFLESLWLKAQRSKNNIHVTDILPGYVDTVMAKGNIFWKSSLEKACQQIYTAIRKKKKKAYITKRWRLIGILLKVLPSSLLNKVA